MITMSSGRRCNWRVCERRFWWMATCASRFGENGISVEVGLPVEKGAR